MMTMQNALVAGHGRRYSAAVFSIDLLPVLVLSPMQPLSRPFVVIRYDTKRLTMEEKGARHILRSVHRFLHVQYWWDALGFWNEVCESTSAFRDDVAGTEVRYSIDEHKRGVA